MVSSSFLRHYNETKILLTSQHQICAIGADGEQFPSKTTPGVSDASDYEEYTYDANGNRLTLRKREGVVISYQYDALGRVVRKTLPERSTGPNAIAATHTRDVFYGYDLRGLQTFARFDSVAATSDGLSTTYDALGQPTTSTLRMDGVDRAIGHEYSLAGARTKVIHPDGNFFTYTLDVAGRPTAIRANGGTTIASFRYNNRGAMDQMSGGVLTNMGFDNAGRLTSINHDLYGTTQDVSFTMGNYNPSGQVGNRTVSNTAYVWGGAVNLSRNYATNGQNQYSTAGNVAFTYDPNGNLTSETPSGGGTRQYRYDIENRLVEVWEGGAQTVALRYDPLGRLYEVSGVNGITRFLWDGDELIAEYSASGALLRRYVHGARVDDPIVWYEGATVASGPARRLRTDHQGSVIAVTNWSGVAQTINSYDEWGIPATTNAGRFQYTGQIWLPELGMYHYKARIYSPTLGRFLQTDPVGYEDQVNLYAYVGNDPVNITDPTGKVGCAIGKSDCYFDEDVFKVKRSLTPDEAMFGERRGAESKGERSGSEVDEEESDNPSNVNMSGSIIIFAIVGGGAYISGELYDTSTKKYREFSGWAFGGGAAGIAAGEYKFNGTVQGFDYLDGGLLVIGHASVTYKGAGLGGTRVLNDKSEFGEVEMGAGLFSIPVGGVILTFDSIKVGPMRKRR